MLNYKKVNLFGERLQLDLFGNIEDDKVKVNVEEVVEYEDTPHNLFDTQTYIQF